CRLSPDLAYGTARLGSRDLGHAMLAHDQAARIDVRQSVTRLRCRRGADAAILRTGSDSPVNSDSSVVRPCETNRVASAGTRSPSAKTIRSPRRIRAGNALLDPITDHQRAWTGEVAQALQHTFCAPLPGSPRPRPTCRQANRNRISAS